MTLSSITAVVVVVRDPPQLPDVSALSDMLAKLATDSNIVLVANGTDTETALKLKDLITHVPDSTVVFLDGLHHDDIARLVGIDHAIGDYILFTGTEPATLAEIPRLVESLAEGHDLVVGRSAIHREVSRGLGSRLLFRAFRVGFRWVTGVPFDPRPVGLRVLTRSAALYLATRVDGEVLIRSTYIGSGFPSKTIAIPNEAAVRGRGIETSAGLSKGLRLLLTTSAVPLRIASYVGLAAGALALVYSLYVAGIYLLKDDVAPGWTTLSMQVSAMMFIFSIMFVFFAEYQIQLMSARPPQSRRQFVIREISSPLSRRTNRLNVVDAEGAFTVGAPKEYVEIETARR